MTEREWKIEEIIPHRYPFLLVDRLLEVVPGKKAKGLKNVTINEPFFQGHFPNQPVMPGMLIVEALAQVGAAALLSKEEHQGKLVLFTGIEKFRFKQIVRPGDTLMLDVELTQIRLPFGKGEGEARVNGKLAAGGSLMFAISEYK
ncbi:MAG: 3-hydroxyacyl-ACP dehydratase FabZ [Firmicutes bacterium]|nr:3-hydroxyacyl-ACP dehydratase FabZ [Bacillota bacterium]